MKTFAGLTSRWKMPLACAAPRAWRDLDAVFERLAIGQRALVEPLAQRLAFQELGDHVGDAPSTPASKTPRMFGWFRAPVARASRLNRSRCSAVIVTDGCRTLRATSRWRRGPAPCTPDPCRPRRGGRRSRTGRDGLPAAREMAAPGSRRSLDRKTCSPILDDHAADGEYVAMHVMASRRTRKDPLHLARAPRDRVSRSGARGDASGSRQPPPSTRSARSGSSELAAVAVDAAEQRVREGQCTCCCCRLERVRRSTGRVRVLLELLPP